MSEQCGVRDAAAQTPKASGPRLCVCMSTHLALRIGAVSAHERVVTCVAQ